MLLLSVFFFFFGPNDLHDQLLKPKQPVCSGSSRALEKGLQSDSHGKWRNEELKEIGVAM